ncbi:hypothetical protein ACR3SY_001606 [Listeria monocytogenes]|nr:hypothetical protein [Listeria monocytogenes]EEO1909343.1 hypothetical protein [Listeria monocytogenes]
MKAYRFNDSEINKLDEWLVSIPNRNKRSLNPLQFSIDRELREEIAINIFQYASSKEIKVLKKNFKVFSDDRMTILGSYNLYTDIPDKIYDEESNTFINVLDINIDITFELIAFPICQPSVSEITSKIVAQPLSAEGCRKSGATRMLLDY